MHHSFSFLILIAFLFVTGCATTDDLRRVRVDLLQQLSHANEKISDVEQRLVDAKAETALLRKEGEKNNEKTDEAIRSLRSNQAETRAATTELRDQIQQIRGAIDGLKKDMTTSSARTSKREDEERGLREKLDNLTFKINFLENYLGMGKKDEPADSTAEKTAKPPAPKDAGAKVRTDKESLYTAAYELFREAKYEKSREGFEHFLKQYPDTEFSDNAQFWIGECYYFEKKYEKAIIEYDKVVKNFPEGNKIPFALLKQGLSFEKLGDKASAKLLLQQVIRDFPNSSQSRIARTKLLEIK